ncbi:hypothetical protein NPIL_77241 [Nephila pilipes]|uniref:Uncharacterized protein n=1 Tax=Nephila pilipes TaxID=299642 RepID=A0A8X6TRY6_NEPPI|nr:hypothetical protein NPIL_77241 [Nephila pilipes]
MSTTYVYHKRIPIPERTRLVDLFYAKQLSIGYGNIPLAGSDTEGHNKAMKMISKGVKYTYKYMFQFRSSMVDKRSRQSIRVDQSQ